MLKKCLPLHRAHQLNESRDYSTATILENEIGKLISAKDEKEARALWNQGYSFWEAQHAANLSNEVINDNLKVRAYKAIIPSLLEKNGSIFKDKHEREYAEDFIELEKNDKNRDKTKQYKECVLVLYFSDDEEVKILRSNLTGRFPHLPRHEQINRYCDLFGKLWNEVSIINEHSEGQAPPEDSCVPQDEDLKRYTEHLIGKRKSDLAYVAETLYTIM